MLGGGVGWREHSPIGSAGSATGDPVAARELAILDDAPLILQRRH